jgi:ATP-dependent DNA helicase RecQ
MYSRGLALLREMLGPGAGFHPGQWQAIEALAVTRRRVLLVQRTGWGKSIVYFIATKLLRQEGAGPTLLISPLLSLMRNQIAMAERIGVRACTLNCDNREEWERVEADLAADRCDILLVSPERLSNERFQKTALGAIRGRVGLLVVDEAHCISDWGHDFRPDYRRITRILQGMPKGVAVLGTTATANNRVMADVQKQLGTDLVAMRGPLSRPSLRLQNLNLPDQSQRLAWLAENLNRFKGSGIIYCLTIADTERVARWLQARGIDARAYHAGDDLAIDRAELEQALLDNQVKALVATVALGMGFDKPDLSFVIHFQRPGSVVAYYQQVGRAGRAIERAYGILLSGSEEDDIQKYFIENAFPKPDIMEEILDVLAPTEGLSMNELLAKVNVARPVAERALKLLEVDGAVGTTHERSKTAYFRTPKPWLPDFDRVEQITELRRQEMAQMRAYVQHQDCLMEFLAKALDDPEPSRCGVCANCQGRGFTGQVSPTSVSQAVEYLQGEELVQPPRKRWPAGFLKEAPLTIPADQQNATGRVLSYYGDSGWGKWVREGKYLYGHFNDQLVQAAADLIRQRWRPDPPPQWLTAIPSRRHTKLVFDFAKRLAGRLDLPFIAALTCTKEVPEQKMMANSSMQARNVHSVLAVTKEARSGPVLLVDDIIDSGWTMTVAGWLLRQNGSGPVYPFALARATVRNN